MSSARADKRLPSFWKIQIGGWLIYFVMIYVTFLSVAPEGSFLRLFVIKGFRTLVGFCLTCVLRLVYRRFGDRLSLERTVALALAGAILFGLAWTWIEMAFSALTNPAAFNFSSTLARSPRIALDYAMTITAWSGLYFGIKSWLAWQRERERALESAAQAAAAQLEVLRYQLNPHFLFNSLNSLRASIDEDPRRARQMVTRLAEFLRYSLLADGAKEVPLDKEIEAAQNYLAIEKVRFEDKLEVEFEAGLEARDFRVPCFLLNPLVENAVKHGFNNSPKPLKIRVAARVENDALLLEVSNTGRLGGCENGTRIGLKNLRERLAKSFPGRNSFTLTEGDGWVRARISIQRA
ncbi:MAG TPA: histidine kinase [Pyrinomonadaceae bacterium]|nr:histidine kinase [Pyrinomonadaceae bacterium]